MFSKICTYVSQSKNILMLIVSALYMLAVFSVLSSKIIPITLLFSLLLLLLIIKNHLSLKYIITFLIIFYIGIINTSTRLKDVDDLLNLAPVNSEITGTIISIPQGMSEKKTKFFFKVDKINFDSVEKKFKSEKALVSINQFNINDEKIKELSIYKHVRLNGRLSMPFKAGNPSQFDYGDYLRNHNAYAVFYANDFTIIEHNSSFKEKLLQNINNYRENILKIHSKYLPSPNLEILGGIVFGDDAVSPPQNIKQSFVNSGLLHILAASGMNVAFIYGFFFLLMSVFKVPFKIRVVLGMIMVCIYSLMTGLGASVIRATCMLLFVLAGKLIDRDAHSISLLSFVALLMLLYNPLWINDVGFQLSFIVTFGILIMAPAFDRFKNKIANFIVSTVAIPVIAQLWVIPIQIFYFNNISLYSVFANIMSVPIVMVLSFGGFISSLIATVKPIADIICKFFDYILNPMINLLVNISDFWGNLPFSSLQTTHPAVYQIILYYGLLLCLSIFLYKELREKYLKLGIISCTIFLSLLLISLLPHTNSNLEITVFDVGNADCFLIKSPTNDYIMIDTGKTGYNGGKSQAEIIVLKYMKDNGIKNLDSIVITHFDNDHCGGAVDLIEGVNVNKIYVNSLNHDSVTAKNIYQKAKTKNTKIELAENLQTMYDKKGLKLINLRKYEGKSDNDNSVITLLTYKDFSMLFTGDAGINGIKSVLPELPKNITVLKAPHHGAVGGIDAEIAQYLNPKYSVISTGENKFGHPSLYTLALLKNSQILRTDINNSLRFVINKNKFEVLSYNIKARKYKKL